MLADGLVVQARIRVQGDVNIGMGAMRRLRRDRRGLFPVLPVRLFLGFLLVGLVLLLGLLLALLARLLVLGLARRLVRIFRELDLDENVIGLCP